jgi:AraC family transcriptional regulator
MEPTIKTLQEKKLVGMRLNMSLTNNKTQQLWQHFMSKRKEITNSVGDTLYSLQNYAPYYFSNFNPDTSFEKWAAIEVRTHEQIPVLLEPFILPGGLYAVFLYKGNPQEGAGFFQYIFGTWLPKSGYELDHRPHFETLGEKYKNGNPESEEEIWIPVKP